MGYNIVPQHIILPNEMRFSMIYHNYKMELNDKVNL